MTGGIVMDSNIASAIALKYLPVALIGSYQKPEDVVQFKEQKWGCIMWPVHFWSAPPGRVW